MRCCAHILNLIVKDGLDVMKIAIENIRESVAYWTATPKRAEKFEEIATFLKVPMPKSCNLTVKLDGTLYLQCLVLLVLTKLYWSVLRRWISNMTVFLLKLSGSSHWMW
jgi:hypothetical protein